MHRLRGLAVLTGIALAGVPGVAPAQAAVDRTVAAGPEPLALAFTTEVGVGVLSTSPFMKDVPCGSTGHSCDMTLIEADRGGDLTFTIGSDEGLIVDVDLRLHAAGPGGEPQGPALARSDGGTPFESISISPGGPVRYVAVIEWFLGAGVVDADLRWAPAG